jgi:hypothetical protein
MSPLPCPCTVTTAGALPPLGLIPSQPFWNDTTRHGINDTTRHGINVGFVGGSFVFVDKRDGYNLG